MDVVKYVVFYLVLWPATENSFLSVDGNFSWRFCGKTPSDGFGLSGKFSIAFGMLLKLTYEEIESFTK